jgi:hypothetical protein
MPSSSLPSPCRIALALAFGVVGAALAWPAMAAEASAVIVVPGRPGVPVMYFGRDISGAVVEGDWGLDRPGHGEITIIQPGPRVLWGAGSGGYFPSSGQAPRYGREEVEPPANRKLPPKAESYHRAWGAASEPLPASSTPPVDAPPVLLGPQLAPSPGRTNPRPIRLSPRAP